jgi:hypothetical protein
VPLCAGHTKSFRASPGSFQQPAQLLDGQGPPVPTPVHPNVQSFQVDQGIVEGSPGLDCPSAELFAGLQVEIERLGGNARFILDAGPQIGHEGTHPVRVYVSERSEAAAIENPADAPGHKGNVPLCPSLSSNSGREVGQVILQWLCLGHAVRRQESNSNQLFPNPGFQPGNKLRQLRVNLAAAGPVVGNQLVEVAAQFFGRGLNETGKAPDNLQLVLKLHIPLGRFPGPAAAILVSGFEHSHWSYPFLFGRLPAAT